MLFTNSFIYSLIHSWQFDVLHIIPIVGLCNQQMYSLYCCIIYTIRLLDFGLPCYTNLWRLGLATTAVTTADCQLYVLQQNVS